MPLEEDELVFVTEALLTGSATVSLCDCLLRLSKECGGGGEGDDVDEEEELRTLEIISLLLSNK